MSQFTRGHIWRVCSSCNIPAIGISGQHQFRPGNHYEVQRYFPWVIADELKVLLEAENGLGAFTVSCNSPRTSFTMDIFGTERSLHLNNFTMSMIQHKSRGNRMIRDLAIDDLKSGLQLAIGAAASSLRTVFGRSSYESGHRVITQGFLNSIRDNTEPPVTGEAGREAIRILEQMWKQMGQPKSSSPRKDSDE